MGRCVPEIRVWAILVLRGWIGDVAGWATQSGSAAEASSLPEPRTTRGSKGVRDGGRTGKMDTNDMDRAVGWIGEADTLLLAPVGVGLDPSTTPTRRGSMKALVEGLGEVGCWCLFGDEKGIDIRDSMFLEDVEDDGLRGIGILEDLDGREFMTTEGSVTGVVQLKLVFLRLQRKTL